jgi:fructuronate reductase
LMRRFVNPALPHRTAQVAMDGSQKLPQRWIATVRDNLAAGRSVRRLAVSVAAWMRYVGGRDESGQAIDVVDPLAARFAALAAAHKEDPRGLAQSLFGIESIFGDDLRAEPRIVEPVIEALSSLFDVGAARTLARFAGPRGS